MSIFLATADRDRIRRNDRAVEIDVGTRINERNGVIKKNVSILSDPVSTVCGSVQRSEDQSDPR